MLKYKICVLFLFLFGIYNIKIIASTNNDFPLIGKTIYLDAGHGGFDSGANYKNILEKDINLEISLKLEEELTKLGAIVYQTRYGDYDLAKPNSINRKRSDLSMRAKIINESKCDLFLSIHLNAEETGIWNGPQVFYNDNNPNNIKIAELFQKKLNKGLNGNREIKRDNSLFLQKRINRPGILLEVGFLSNSNDRYLLKQKNYQNKIVDIINKSIISYFNNDTNKLVMALVNEGVEGYEYN